MPFPSTPFGDRSGLRRPGRLLRPLLTSASRSGRLAASSVLSDTVRISRGKPGVLRRAPAGFTVPALDGYGLRESLPARPANPASYPVSVRRAATSLHASFRRSLAVPPLRFARASPPSGCTGDFHPQDAGYARHTGCEAPPAAAARWAVLDFNFLSRSAPPCKQRTNPHSVSCRPSHYPICTWETSRGEARNLYLDDHSYS